MTSKKDPPKKPEPVPGAPLEAQPREVALEIFARAGGTMEGLHGDALEEHVQRAIAAGQRIIADVDRHVGEEEQRKAAAAEIEQLLDTLIRTGSDTGKALEGQRQPLLSAFRNADLQALAGGMQQLMAWITNPTPDTEQQAKALLAQLEATVGPAFGLDPQAAEEARRAQMKADVRRSLDAAFRGKDFAATLKKKPER